MAVVGLAYSPHTYGLYYTPRVALLYPLVAALVVVALAAGRPKGAGPAADLLDLLLLLFVAWQAVAALWAPVWTLAWFGAYNRIGGAVLWAAVAALTMVARRFLVSRPALEPFVWMVAATVGAASLVGVLQGFGVTTPWRFDDIWWGRMPGTTGNPLDLAGLCLFAVWLAGMATGYPLRRATRAAAVAAAALALAGIVVSVSRSAYLCIALATVFYLVVWSRRRRWRAIVALLAVLVCMGVATAAYDPEHTGASALSGRIAAHLDAGTYGLAQSDASRGTFWRVAAKAVAARPLLGYGPGGYVVAYRRFVPAATLQQVPLSSVTDPHDLALLVVTGSGIPGLVLALAALAFVVARAAPRVRSFSRRGPPGGAMTEDEAQNALVTAAAAGALVWLAFLALSPGDPTSLVPLALMFALAAGPPRHDAHTTVTLGSGPALRAGWACALAVAVAGLVAAVVLGVQLYRADAAIQVGTTELDQAQATRATRLMPWVPPYGLIAGALTVRNGVAAGQDASLLAAGERELRDSLAGDPTAPSPRIELIRYYLSFRQTGKAMVEIREGLRTNPNNPVLQGLWGYAAQAAARDPSQKDLAPGLIRGLEAYPGKSADGWYWLGEALAASGDKAGAWRAFAAARAIDPDLGPAHYAERLRGIF